MPMAHKFALCRKTDGHCVQRSVLLPTEPVDDTLEWLAIDQKAEPVFDKDTEALDVVTEKIDGKLTMTYTKRAMTEKELSERII